MEQMPAIDQGKLEMKRLDEARSPLAVMVDAGAGRIEVSDRDQRFAYELHFRDGRGRFGGPGWLERIRNRAKISYRMV